jgi:hypothetical protein
LNTGVMCLELDASVLGEVEDMLHGFTVAQLAQCGVYQDWGRFRLTES